METSLENLKMCQNNLTAVRNCLYHVEGTGKGGAERWIEVVQESLARMIKELELTETFR